MKLIYPNTIASYLTVTGCFTTRDGGVSASPYHSLNLAFHVGDNTEDVINNHTLLASHLGYNHYSLVHMKQIHSDCIVEINETHAFDTPPTCDALITNRPNIPLMAMSADCTPILLYDTKHHAIGVVHAGRAGALSEILPKTILQMSKSYGTDINHLLVILGPSIHGCCYEINDIIAQTVKEKGYDKALTLKNKKVFLDVNTILLQQLNIVGILRANIEAIDHCTACQSDTYFSYRAHDQHTGRIAGVIMLR